jgi:hypothetical protein
VKKLAIALALAAVLLAGTATADKIVWVWTAQGTPAQTTVDTSGFQTAQVSIWAASGSPDGTVTIYLVPPGNAQLVTLATYATPTTVKTFRGPAGSTLAIALAGNTTGTVAANVVLK